MKFNVPPDYCTLATDIRSAVLKSAERALSENKPVFFQEKQFTNIDELKSHLTETCKSLEPEHDWNGEAVEDMNG